MSLRDDTLTARLTAFMDRRSPPQRLASNPAALAAETSAVLAAVLRYAPSQGYEAWWERMERRIAETSRTRAWPSENEVADAARALRDQGAGSAVDEQAAESNAVQALADWFARHKTQAAGLGRPDRTARLIRMRVLADEREARFRGFDLDEEAMRRARDARPGRDEWAHHVNVMARMLRFDGMEPREVERACIAEISGYQLPEHLAYLKPADDLAPPPQEPARGFQRMSEATASPRAARSHFEEPRDPLADGPRPYTDAELTRMRALRPQAEPMGEAQG